MFLNQKKIRKFFTLKTVSYMIIMGWMARVAIRVSGVGGADTTDRVEILFFYYYETLYIL
ncbi:hypothetical protein CON65_16690 [Bacillus pseudomycoides]|uniref:Uncharacterized protein n=1 Tax=Bacillus pseudomycoides TaxID=64104 RepID=A0AA91ZSA9_9BACI|nr:hypothetical protein COO03_14250 [Bacillus sp. AFS098217]PED81520.1 hypothetical protein CON65_16690 [Bacillus pseudomycoides]PEU07200.1 hypothetical protein CN524_21320 [Bacillus sp. AFS019443]PEU09907.1 hypothetical protein CN525_24150 [Bacillus sp. AFS014408]PFW60074.1 hypothetical protein COL20_23265 [Bacillus sp. AFS075034]